MIERLLQAECVTFTQWSSTQLLKNNIIIFECKWMETENKSSCLRECTPKREMDSLICVYLQLNK